MNYEQPIGTYASPDRTYDGAKQATLSQVAPASEIEQITARIHSMATGFEGIASQLCDHADRLHGVMPEAESDGRANPCRIGRIGDLHDALDRLDRVQSHVALQAGRNCNIA